MLGRGHFSLRAEIGGDSDEDGGLFVAPRRVWRSFVRGRRGASLYGRDYESLLRERIETLRRETGTDRAPPSIEPWRRTQV